MFFHFKQFLKGYQEGHFKQSPSIAKRFFSHECLHKAQVETIKDLSRHHSERQDGVNSKGGNTLHSCILNTFDFGFHLIQARKAGEKWSRPKRPSLHGISGQKPPITLLGIPTLG